MMSLLCCIVLQRDNGLAFSGRGDAQRSNNKVAAPVQCNAWLSDVLFGTKFRISSQHHDFNLVVSS